MKKAMKVVVTLLVFISMTQSVFNDDSDVVYEGDPSKQTVYETQMSTRGSVDKTNKDDAEDDMSSELDDDAKSEIEKGDESDKDDTIKSEEQQEGTEVPSNSEDVDEAVKGEEKLSEVETKQEPSEKNDDTPSNPTTKGQTVDADENDSLTTLREVNIYNFDQLKALIEDAGGPSNINTYNLMNSITAGEGGIQVPDGYSFIMNGKIDDSGWINRYTEFNSTDVKDTIRYQGTSPITIDIRHVAINGFNNKGLITTVNEDANVTVKLDSGRYDGPLFHDIPAGSATYTRSYFIIYSRVAVSPVNAFGIAKNITFGGNNRVENTEPIAQLFDIRNQGNIEFLGDANIEFRTVSPLVNDDRDVVNLKMNPNANVTFTVTNYQSRNPIIKMERSSGISPINGVRFEVKKDDDTPLPTVIDLGKYPGSQLDIINSTFNINAKNATADKAVIKSNIVNITDSKMNTTILKVNAPIIESTVGVNVAGSTIKSQILGELRGPFIVSNNGLHMSKSNLDLNISNDMRGNLVQSHIDGVYDISESQIVVQASTLGSKIMQGSSMKLENQSSIKINGLNSVVGPLFEFSEILKVAGGSSFDVAAPMSSTDTLIDVDGLELLGSAFKISIKQGAVQTVLKLGDLGLNSDAGSSFKLLTPTAKSLIGTDAGGTSIQFAEQQINQWNNSSILDSPEGMKYLPEYHYLNKGSGVLHIHYTNEKSQSESVKIITNDFKSRSPEPMEQTISFLSDNEPLIITTGSLDFVPPKVEITDYIVSGITIPGSHVEINYRSGKVMKQARGFANNVGKYTIYIEALDPSAPKMSIYNDYLYVFDKVVDWTERGSLQFGEMPDVLNFKDKKISSGPKEYQRDERMSIEVSDTRQYGIGWKLELVVTSNIYDANGVRPDLDGNLVFIAQDGTRTNLVKDQPIVVMEGNRRSSPVEKRTFGIASGIVLKVNDGSGVYIDGDYKADIKWVLTDTR